MTTAEKTLAKLMYEQDSLRHSVMLDALAGSDLILRSIARDYEENALPMSNAWTEFEKRCDDIYPRPPEPMNMRPCECGSGFVYGY